MRRLLFFVAPAAGALTLLAGCGSDGSPQVLQESVTRLGDFDVKVTLDSALRVCTNFPSGSLGCLGAQTAPGSGIQTAMLDAVPEGSYVLRLLVEPGARLDDLPADQTRLPVAMNTELVMALYETAPACFHWISTDGESHTVTVTATAVDTGSGVTAAATAGTAC